MMVDCVRRKEEPGLIVEGEGMLIQTGRAFVAERRECVCAGEMRKTMSSPGTATVLVFARAQGPS